MKKNTKLSIGYLLFFVILFLFIYAADNPTTPLGGFVGAFYVIVFIILFAVLFKLFLNIKFNNPEDGKSWLGKNIIEVIVVFFGYILSMLFLSEYLLVGIKQFFRGNISEEIRYSIPALIVLIIFGLRMTNRYTNLSGYLDSIREIFFDFMIGLFILCSIGLIIGNVSIPEVIGDSVWSITSIGILYAFIFALLDILINFKVNH